MLELIIKTFAEDGIGFELVRKIAEMASILRAGQPNVCCTNFENIVKIFLKLIVISHQNCSDKYKMSLFSV